MNEQQGLDPMFQENGSQWMEGGLASEPLNVYTAKTFGWMFLGLLVTFGTAIAFSAGGGLYYLLTMGMPAVFALAIAEIVVVMVLSARLHKLSIGAARGLFFAYAVLNGITFSAVFFAYDVQILLTVFALTSLYFGVLAAYGWFTKRDLSGLRPILTAGLIFLLVFWLISMFLPLSGFDRIICFVGLAVFMGLTAGFVGGNSVPEHMPRIADLGALEPAHMRHRARAQNCGERRLRFDFVIVPDAAPEGVEILYRPAPQILEACELKAVLRLEPFRIETHLRDRGRDICADAGMGHRGAKPCSDRREIEDWFGVASGEAPRCGGEEGRHLYPERRPRRQKAVRRLMAA